MKYMNIGQKKAYLFLGAKSPLEIPIVSREPPPCVQRTSTRHQKLSRIARYVTTSNNQQQLATTSNNQQPLSTSINNQQQLAIISNKSLRFGHSQNFSHFLRINILMHFFTFPGIFFYFINLIKLYNSSPSATSSNVPPKSPFFKMCLQIILRIAQIVGVWF